MTTTTIHSVRSVLALTLCALGTACITSPGKLGGLDEDGDGGMAEDGTGGPGGASATSTGGGDGQDADDDAGDSSAGVDPPACEVQIGSSAGRVFDGVKWHNTVADLLGVESTVAVDAPGGPAVPAPSPSTINPIVYEAEANAVAGAADVLSLLSCSPDTALPEADACIESFATELGRLAWRRALTPDQIAALVALDPDASVEDRARLVVRSLLSAPQFWTIDQSGAPDPSDPGVLILDDHAIASRLSYFVWNSMPDAELLARAEAGELSDPSVRAAEVDRMLDDPRAARAIGDYWEAVLDTGDLRGGEHDPVLFPQMDDTLVAAMREEVRRLAADVVLGEGTWSALLGATHSYVNGPLAAGVYGAEVLGAAPTGEAFELVELDPARRPGLLTRAAPMARWAHAAYIGTSWRGLFVRQRLLCHPIPPPPPDIDVNPIPELSDDRYEVLQQHAADAQCSACHQLFDPITPGFDNYDSIGQWQTEITALGGPPANGQPTVPVNSSGTVWLESGDVAFADRDELLALLATNPESLSCQVRHQLEYAYGRLLGEDDLCMLDTMAFAFAEGGGDLRQLVYEIVASDAFVRVRPE